MSVYLEYMCRPLINDESFYILPLDKTSSRYEEFYRKTGYIHFGQFEIFEI